MSARGADYGYWIRRDANRVPSADKFSLPLPLGIQVINKKAAYSKINHKSEKINCDIIHLHEKSVLQFCYSAVQACAETMML